MNQEKFERDLKEFLDAVANPNSMSVNMSDLKAGFIAGYLKALEPEKSAQLELASDCGCANQD